MKSNNNFYWLGDRLYMDLGQVINIRAHRNPRTNVESSNKIDIAHLKSTEDGSYMIFIGNGEILNEDGTQKIFATRTQAQDAIYTILNMNNTTYNEGLTDQTLPMTPKDKITSDIGDLIL